MGVMEGGTMSDLARIQISLSFDFEKKGTKKTIEQIFNERAVGDRVLFPLAKKEANRMVARRFLHHNLDKRIYVFSRDGDGKYSWQPATFTDRILNYFSKHFAR